MACSTTTPALVRWLKDESFFSLCCRQHRSLCYVDASSTTTWLFGAGCRVLPHDFPCYLDSLTQEAKECWGGPLTIIQEHTIFPMFCPFQSEERVKAALEAMYSPRLDTIKYRLGLVTSRYGAEHPLKACPACIADDRAKYGVAYWHTSHQYPGVTLCPIHGDLIRICSAKRQWSGLTGWVLPSEDILEIFTAPELNQETELILKKLGETVLDLANYGLSIYFNSDNVSKVYKEALHQVSLTSAQRTKIEADLAEFALHLQPFLPLASLPTTPKAAATFLAHMSRKPRSHYHPLKHLILITWLFGGLRPFQDAMNRLKPRQINQAQLPPPISAGLVEPEKEGNAAMSLSLNPKSLKPKKLIPALREKIRNSLLNGISKNSICDQHRISICTINRLLRAEPQIRSTWKEKQQLITKRKHRAAWSRATIASPNAGPKRIRSLLPKVYQWLYRNDRTWLIAKIKKMPCERQGNHADTDWDVRDRELCELIRAVILENYSAAAQLQLCKSDIFELVPILHRSLEKRDRYPQTRKLLERILAEDSLLVLQAMREQLV